MKKIQYNRGFTLAEVLIVVGILAVLAGVAFINVQSYMRSMEQLERDGIAKEIFMAAQNHLAAAESQDYLSLSNTEFGTAESKIDGVSDSGDGTFYFVVDDYDSQVHSGGSLLALMLPPAALDDTVRLGGSYVVRYHKDSGQVLDVFYTKKTGRYKLTLTETDYPDLLKKRGDNNRDARKTYSRDNAVVGYYGGTEALGLTVGDKLNMPGLKVENKERLIVTVTDTNDVINRDDVKMRLAVTGLTSGKTKTVELNTITTGGYDIIKKTFTIVLDDITTSGKRFFDLYGDEGLIPGEDIVIRVDVENTAQLTASQFREETTNSLFGYDPNYPMEDANTARIENIRHLENLSAEQSMLGNSGIGEKTVSVTTAEQTSDLSWTDFKKVIKPSDPDSVQVFGNTAGKFLPISPAVALSTYKGGNHSITDVQIAATANAGVFQSLKNATVENLTLKDFDIATTSGSAGALAGAAENATLQNVLAWGENAQITGTVNAGGLIGSMSGGTVQNSAAAVYVTASGSAGGLIGTADGTTVKYSYSGGHTNNGEYKNSAATDRYEDNVRSTGGDAGGLIGTLSGTGSVENCYSTCSVSGTTAVGGLVGADTGVSISGCYATGLVSGGTETTGTFAGTVSADNLIDGNNYYYEIINQNQETDIPPVGGNAGISLNQIDKDLKSYNEFVTLESGAKPYDNKLASMYGGQYGLKAVTGYGHYGDWPAPETLVINVK